jgi:hypothetical protein
MLSAELDWRLEWKTTLAETGRRLEVAAYRGFDHDEIVMDEDRGAFFSTDEAYAASYGAVIRRYTVTLENPLVVSEKEEMGTIEIDRVTLLELGYDGRVIAYGEGSLDVVAFDRTRFVPDVDTESLPRR